MQTSVVMCNAPFRFNWSKNWNFAAPKLTCHNPKRYTKLYRRISHVWYRGTNQSCSTTRSISFDKNVCTISNGDKSTCLVRWTHSHLSPAISFLAPHSWSLWCFLLHHFSLSLPLKKTTMQPINCWVRYHDAWCKMSLEKWCVIHMKPRKYSNKSWDEHVPHLHCKCRENIQIRITGRQHFCIWLVKARGDVLCDFFQSALNRSHCTWGRGRLTLVSLLPHSM